MKSENKAGLLILALFVVILTGGVYLNKLPTTAVVETRNEHLVWSSKGCKVYQLVIKNEWGPHVLFITTPTREDSPLKQVYYPTCRVTTP